MLTLTPRTPTCGSISRRSLRGSHLSTSESFRRPLLDALQHLPRLPTQTILHASQQGIRAMQGSSHTQPRVARLASILSTRLRTSKGADKDLTRVMLLRARHGLMLLQTRLLLSNLRRLQVIKSQRALPKVRLPVKFSSSNHPVARISKHRTLALLLRRLTLPWRIVGMRSLCTSTSSAWTIQS